MHLFVFVSCLILGAWDGLWTQSINFRGLILYMIKCFRYAYIENKYTSQKFALCKCFLEITSTVSLFALNKPTQYTVISRRHTVFTLH